MAKLCRKQKDVDQSLRVFGFESQRVSISQSSFIKEAYPVVANNSGKSGGFEKLS